MGLLWSRPEPADLSTLSTLPHITSPAKEIESVPDIPDACRGVLSSTLPHINPGKIEKRKRKRGRRIKKSLHERRLIQYRQQLENEPPADHTAFTDGSCLTLLHMKDEIRRVAGIGVYFGIEDSRNCSEAIEASVGSGESELMAAIRALEVCGDGQASLRIETDCEEVMRAADPSLPFRWHSQPALCLQLRNKIKDRQGPVYWRKVPAHYGIHGNVMADRLAQTAAKKALSKLTKE
ncbi:ribonuclease H-like domain-containing protein [Spinellus fusiger]|nr:ribonuclease H-like domain-containing protein [Spinellus fusiger]